MLARAERLKVFCEVEDVLQAVLGQVRDHGRQEQMVTSSGRCRTFSSRAGRAVVALLRLCRHRTVLRANTPRRAMVLLLGYPLHATPVAEDVGGGPGQVLDELVAGLGELSTIRNSQGDMWRSLVSISRRINPSSKLS